MSDLLWAALAGYGGALALLSVYGIHRLWNLIAYLRHRRDVPAPRAHFAPLPPVTVQLPLYNEQYVVDRLIDAVCALDYPLDLLEIQVLDDSTDETRTIAEAKVRTMRERGIDIRYLHRPHRHGYKAGALEEGVRRARGEFVLIFDADFVPTPDILRKTIHFFTDPGVGMVQVRWDHLNRGFSLLTQVQAILLDGHFVIEHTARHRAGRFFNFNGTAGIWRRSCIADAGGWEHDTLTEDLDLSYRAQLKGWKFVYLNDVVAPAELPVEVNSFKSQQKRWAKGNMQTGVKLLGSVWRSALPFLTKVEATFHLTNNVAYLLMLFLSLFLLPATIARGRLGDAYWKQFAVLDALVFAAASGSVLSFYFYTVKEVGGRWLSRLPYIAMLLCVGIGLSVNNSLAVLEALLGRRSEFERTPKHNVRRREDSWTEKKYRGVRNMAAYGELAMGVFGLIVVEQAIEYHLYTAVPFLVLFPIGFLYTAALSLLQGKIRRGAGGGRRNERRRSPVAASGS